MADSGQPLPCDASLLSAYHDDALDAPTRRLMDAHLRACAACRAELAAYERLAAALRAMPIASMRPRLPADVAARASRRRNLTPARFARRPSP